MLNNSINLFNTSLCLSVQGYSRIAYLIFIIASCLSGSLHNANLERLTNEAKREIVLLASSAVFVVVKFTLSVLFTIVFIVLSPISDWFITFLIGGFLTAGGYSPIAKLICSINI